MGTGQLSVLHVYLLGVPEAVSLLGSGVYRHDDSIFSASAYSVTQKPSRDCHCILDPDRGRGSVQHDCGQLSTVQIPLVGFSTFADVSIQAMTVTTCILTLRSHRKLTIDGGNIPD